MRWNLSDHSASDFPEWECHQAYSLQVIIIQLAARGAADAAATGAATAAGAAAAATTTAIAGAGAGAGLASGSGFFPIAWATISFSSLSCIFPDPVAGLAA